MRRTIAVLLLLVASSLFASEDMEFSFFVSGRAPLEETKPDSPEYGLVESAVFHEQPITLTVIAVNVPKGDSAWWNAIQWKFTTRGGDRVEPPPTLRIAQAPDAAFQARRPNASHANFAVTGLKPGRYVVHAAWANAQTGKRSEAEDRLLSVYRGDESISVKREFLRDRAKNELAKGTRQSYEVARAMLLEAAEGNTDPAVYESLADASAPWAIPDETASYYERSLAIARQNLEQRLGKQQAEWPSAARTLWTKHERKVKMFQDLLPYYRANFQQVRVVVLRQPMASDKFVVERRSDGARLRTVEPHP